MPEDDPHHPQDESESESDTGSGWDKASAARKVANDDARRLKRTVRSKRKKTQDPDWDASGETTPPTQQSDIDQKLHEIEQRFKSHEAKSTSRRSKSRRKQSAFSRHAKKVSTALLATAGVFLLVYMVIIALRPPTGPSSGASPASSKLQILPSLMPKEFTAPPREPRNYTIVPSNDPSFDSVKKTVTGFLTTQSTEKRMALLRPTLDVSAHLEASKKHPLLTLGLAPTFGPAFIVSGDFVYAEINEAGIGVRGAILEKTGERYLLDFDSLIGYSDADWQAISKKQLDSPVTTRALVRIYPKAESPLPGTEVAFVTDPAQNISFPAALTIFDIKKEHIVGALSTGQLLPFVITLSQVEHDGSPILVIDEISYSGWFEQNLFQ